MDAYAIEMMSVALKIMLACFVPLALVFILECDKERHQAGQTWREYLSEGVQEFQRLKAEKEQGKAKNQEKPKRDTLEWNNEILEVVEADKEKREGRA